MLVAFLLIVAAALVVLINLLSEDPIEQLQGKSIDQISSTPVDQINQDVLNKVENNYADPRLGRMAYIQAISDENIEPLYDDLDFALPIYTNNFSIEKIKFDDGSFYVVNFTNQVGKTEAAQFLSNYLLTIQNPKVILYQNLTQDQLNQIAEGI